jgi:hypothetical protein
MILQILRNVKMQRNAGMQHAASTSSLTTSVGSGKTSGKGALARAASTADFGVPCYPAQSIVRRAQVARLMSWRAGPCHGVLRIQITRATGLLAADISGFSDPYVVLHTGGQKRKTRIIKQTLEPEWGEQFEFRGLLDDFLSSGVKLVVYDWDEVGMDDALGECMVKLHPELRIQTVVNPHEYYERLDTEGMLEFNITWLPDSTREQWTPASVKSQAKGGPLTASAASTRTSQAISSVSRVAANEARQVRPETTPLPRARAVERGREHITVPVLLPHKFDYVQELWEQLPRRRPPSAHVFAQDAFRTRRDAYMKRPTFDQT